MNLDQLFSKLKGGPGSGNFGHEGRPGKKGGSSAGGLFSERRTVDIRIPGQGVTGIDEGIADFVKVLNKRGLQTGQSCSGHTCERVLESMISFSVPFAGKGLEAFQKLEKVVNSGKLNLEWDLAPRYANSNIHDLQPKKGLFGEGVLPSSESNVRKAKTDYDTMLDAIR